MARTLAITYGAITVGLGATDAAYNLTDVHGFRQDREFAAVVFTVVVSSATSAAFRTAEASLKAEFRKDDGALTVAMGGGNMHGPFNPANNSALRTRASARRAPGTSTDRSCEYECAVIAELPYDQAGRAGRRDASVQRLTDASERQIAIFRGTYTAQSGGSAALAQYTAEIAAFVQEWTDAFGGTWQVEQEDVRFDDQNKLLQFEARYEKILKGESQAGVDHAAIVRQQIRVNRMRFGDRRAAVFAGQTRPFVLVEILYRANIKSSQSTALQSLYESTIRPHLHAQVTGAALIIHREEFRADPTYNLIEARILARASKAGLIESSVRIEQFDDLGKVPIPVWDGGKFSRRVYDDTADQVITVTVEQLAVTGQHVNAERAIPGGLLGAPYVRVHQSFAVDDGEMGDDTGATILTTIRRDLFVFVRAEEPAAAGLPALPGRGPVAIPPLNPEPTVTGELVPNPFGGAGGFAIGGG